MHDQLRGESFDRNRSIFTAEHMRQIRALRPKPQHESAPMRNKLRAGNLPFSARILQRSTVHHSTLDCLQSRQRSRLDLCGLPTTKQAREVWRGGGTSFLFTRTGGESCGRPMRALQLPIGRERRRNNKNELQSYGQRGLRLVDWRWRVRVSSCNF